MGRGALGVGQGGPPCCFFSWPQASPRLCMPSSMHASPAAALTPPVSRRLSSCKCNPTPMQELYLDQNPDLAELPPALALLPALRRMYVASTPEAQAALQAQAAAVLQGPGGAGPAAAAVAAGVIQQSRPFA